MDRQAAKEAVTAFLAAIGQPATGEREETPTLVADAWIDDLLSGYQHDPAQILASGSFEIDDARADNLVTLRSIGVTAMCPHHLLPAIGEADVVYLPGTRLAGFGAIVRALDAVTRRLTLQEAAGSHFAQLLIDHLGARGAACRMRMTHTCLAARGVRERSAVVESLATAGTFATAGPDRELGLGALHHAGARHHAGAQR